MAGKKYQAVKAKVDRTKVYDYKEAIKLLREVNYANFNASVEVAYFLNVDPRQADQNIRGAMVLPHGTGKTKRVLVVTQGAKVEEAKAAGADFVGGAEILDEIKNGWLGFDIIVATPDMMGQLGKLGRLLGPKGLMPNPKTGTVTMNVASAIEQIKKGQVQYRVDRDGNVNAMIGKLSFTDQQLAENFKAFYDQLNKIKPAAVKGTYMKNIVLSTTMSPGIKVTVE
ncbi:MAG: 50S ribosomal protein L1 [Solobacterium sp.]|nr:50S ribosomal protein L1 [Solobacterium sp.]